MRTHSEPNSCQLDKNADRADNYSASQDNTSANQKFSSCTRQKPGEEHRPIPQLAPRLVDPVFFWQTIQQQLTTNFLAQQHQQIQINPLHLSSTSPSFKSPQWINVIMLIQHE